MAHPYARNERKQSSRGAQASVASELPPLDDGRVQPSDEQRDVLIRTLRENCKEGLYPLVAFGSRDGVVVCLLSTIENLPYAIAILEKVQRRKFTLLPTPVDRINRIAEQNPHVFERRQLSVDWQAGDQQIERWVVQLIASFGSPFLERKAFGLVDICGFSRLDYADQLTYLGALSNIFRQAVGRSRIFSEHLGVHNYFRRASTGDGFYIWNDRLGGNADVATFMLLLCIVVRARDIDLKGFKIKASFVIGSTFILYEFPSDSSAPPFAVNAVGEATNGAARLVTAARPWQILIGDFNVEGTGAERMTPQKLVQQANELFRLERFPSASLVVNPTSMLKVVDKHGESWNCWNVEGKIPQDQDSSIGVGLKPDVATAISDYSFVSPHHLNQ